MHLRKRVLAEGSSNNLSNTDHMLLKRRAAIGWDSDRILTESKVCNYLGKERDQSNFSIGCVWLLWGLLLPRSNILVCAI